MCIDVILLLRGDLHFLKETLKILGLNCPQSCLPVLMLHIGLASSVDEIYAVSSDSMSVSD